MDGIMISAVTEEIKKKLLGFNINKIFQPDPNEIILVANKNKFFISVNPSSPRLHLTNQIKQNPQNAPMFCMILRKHIQNGRIKNITQPNFERIVNLEIESINEFGDIFLYNLVIEIMGRHSNIILIDKDKNIIDAIKHVSVSKSSVRQILPHLKYNFPPNQNKFDPTKISHEQFYNLIKDIQDRELLYKFINGFGSVISKELCLNNTKEEFCRAFFEIQKKIINKDFACEIIFDSENKPIILSAIELKKYNNNHKKKKFISPSEATETFFSLKDKSDIVNQKVLDLYKIISGCISKCEKKIDLQEKSLIQTKEKDKYKLFGELIMANIYKIKSGDDFIIAENYYDNNDKIKINLDKKLSPTDNAQAFFKKYNKLKRTEKATQAQLKINQDELDYLLSVLESLKLCETELDTEEIRDELYQQNILRKKDRVKKSVKKIKKYEPICFVSSDGFNIYIGKNNMQNDWLTTKFASPNDLWLHTKNIPSSHVIIKNDDTKEIPLNTLIEAANLCALHSKLCGSNNVAVDYTKKKFVKKMSGAKPGMVIYENYKTIYVTPDKKLIDILYKK